MCTVTFIPRQSSYILTTNRDEIRTRPTRPPVLIPNEKRIQILAPTDHLKGGTWVGVSEYNRSVCLMNGAFSPHKHSPPYAMSRGTIVIAVLQSEHYKTHLNASFLSGVEPFTLIVVEKETLMEFRWDGKNSHFIPLPFDEARIWSSAMLYPDTVQREREKWFEEWIDKNKTPSKSDVYAFHTQAGVGNPKKDLMMQRENGLQTVSTTSIVKTDTHFHMFYRDHANEVSSEHQLLPKV